MECTCLTMSHPPHQRPPPCVPGGGRGHLMGNYCSHRQAEQQHLLVATIPWAPGLPGPIAHPPTTESEARSLG